ncbi:inositol monophosphatase family protein [Jeotgalibacillus haloalkalitolerans]|uniref:inositol-phosphate phosphatase n=1 Tax=Jeotgalibacillus haloalkalitolerans TaxID=3104292 RepID=A0ABU5KP75_9BACL|nr:inositol monophosphatase family protein [Jeotgalibacillus sp. HH7-29]MDZ5712888.1 inositol monophosphatase family protein [Jeotgalibacillus sp. HH7-29]
MDKNWNDIDVFAKEAIKEAGRKIIDSFDEVLKIQTKTNVNDLVTNMDKQIEKFFVEMIDKQYPEHRVMGEEGFGDQVEDMKGTVWIIDPIDGTMNFVHQQRNFAISIGVFHEGEGVLGYIYDVVSDELYHARKGHGAFLNDEKLSPLKDVPIEEAILSLNATWLVPNRKVDHETFIPLVHRVRGTRSYGSAAIELAYIAAGRLDGYITLRLSPWDFAGGKVLIEEVGGVVTDLNGEELSMVDHSPVFAGNPAVHQEVLNQYLKK